MVVLRDLAADKAESEEQARVIAEKIRVALARFYILTIHYTNNNAKEIIEHHCSSSIGVALFASYDPGANDILKRADVAMYQAKADGRNTVRIYDTT